MPFTPRLEAGGSVSNSQSLAGQLGKSKARACESGAKSDAAKRPNKSGHHWITDEARKKGLGNLAFNLARTAWEPRTLEPRKRNCSPIIRTSGLRVETVSIGRS